MSETDDHLLEAFLKVTLTIPLVDAIKHIHSYAKFVKDICTPHRSPKKIQLNEIISSIICGAFRRFISDFAKVSKPLTTLLCKDNDEDLDMVVTLTNRGGGVN